jgi:hypothetical protein
MPLRRIGQWMFRSTFSWPRRNTWSTMCPHIHVHAVEIRQTQSLERHGIQKKKHCLVFRGLLMLKFFKSSKSICLFSKYFHTMCSHTRKKQPALFQHTYANVCSAVIISTKYYTLLRTRSLSSKPYKHRARQNGPSAYLIKHNAMKIYWKVDV